MVSFCQMVLSSDKISSMHEPVLLLRLNVGSGGVDKEVTFEMTKTELDRTLGTCASIQQVRHGSLLCSFSQCQLCAVARCYFSSAFC